MDIKEIAIPIASTAAGGISVVWLTKIMITNWLRKQDQAMEILRDLDKHMAVLIHRVTSLENDLNGLGNSVRKRLGDK